TYREYGNLAHELFEAVLKKIELTKNYSHLEKGHIDVDIVEGVLKDLVGKNRLTLPKLNEKYYKEIVYKNLANSVEVFFKKISKELGNEKIEKLIVEEDLRSDFKNKTLEVIGRAKADLIIKTDKNIHIIDFKTGGINELQLDFYSILYAGESDKTIKYVFNVDKGELSKSKKIKLVRDNKGKVAVDPEGKNKNLEVLGVKIEEIFREKTFSRNEKQCGRCDYINICKIEEIEMAKKVGEIDGE
ncbi:MAG: PD-(D/E)XK nuclease family protein, partial [Psychrilyobacter sp.]|nr:PD-(D/E)XK nuclease family protein [Psychrilyobacter sp.]